MGPGTSGHLGTATVGCTWPGHGRDICFCAGGLQPVCGSWDTAVTLLSSSSSLVSTNEHLLQELSRARAQHRAEVEQMHWSFQELKKTTALTPHHSSRLGGRQSC